MPVEATAGKVLSDGMNLEGRLRNNKEASGAGRSEWPRGRRQATRVGRDQVRQVRCEGFRFYFRCSGNPSKGSEQKSEMSTNDHAGHE